MFRPAIRSVVGSSLPRALPRNAAARRFFTTAPPHQTSRSWKNKALRLGLAGSIVYWYNTSSVFAEEPVYAVAAPPVASREDENYQTIDSIAEQRRAQARAQQAASKPPVATSATTTAAAPDAEAVAPGGPEGLEEEASQQGAFNEETGEINWDCPCLGGMAHGPCGEQFRTAFSCFVFSKDEPKGVDCIEHFKAMQDCFREHPDIYGAELDDEELEQAQANEDGAQARQAQQASAHEGGEKVSKPYGQDSQAAVESRNERAAAASQQVKEHHVPTSESEEMVPKSWHDATDLNRTEK